MQRQGPAARTRQHRTVMDNEHAAAVAAMDHLPGPGFFSGTAEESGQEWLQKFELWTQCKGFVDNLKMAALALHLKGAAATWHQVLPDVEKDTWTHTRSAFVARYGPNQLAGWQRASQLWSMQQMPGESVLDFIEKIQRAARDVNMAEEQQRFVIINGLRPSIRSHVLRQNPADMAALRQAARLAEQTDATSGTDDNSLAIRRIEQQLQQLTLQSIQQSTVHRESSYNRREDEEDHPSRGRDRSNNQPSRSPSISRRPWPADDDHTSSRSYRRSPTPTMRRQVQFVDDRQHETSFDRRGQRGNFQQNCASCGRNNHRRSECYFRNAVCTGCSKVGHVLRACRSARH